MSFGCCHVVNGGRVIHKFHPPPNAILLIKLFQKRQKIFENNRIDEENCSWGNKFDANGNELMMTRDSLLKKKREREKGRGVVGCWWLDEIRRLRQKVAVIQHLWIYSVSCFASILSTFSKIFQDFPIFSTILQHFSPFSDIFHYYPTFSTTFQSFSKIFQHFPIISSIIQYSPWFSNIFQNFAAFLSNFSDFPSFSYIFQYFAVSSFILPHFPTLSNILQDFPTFYNNFM